MRETPFQSRDDRKPEGPERKVVTSQQLLGGAREIAIRHDGQEYRLQLTRNGKLILTK